MLGCGQYRLGAGVIGRRRGGKVSVEGGDKGVYLCLSEEEVSDGP